MDRLSQPKLTQLESLTPADLPRLLEQRADVMNEIDTYTNKGEMIVSSQLSRRLQWLNEQIAYVKMLEREGRAK